MSAPDLEVLERLRRTAAHYSAQLREFRGMGHDVMLEPRWREPLQVMLDWLAALPATSAAAAD